VLETRQPNGRPPSGANDAGTSAAARAPAAVVDPRAERVPRAETRAPGGSARRAPCPALAT